MKYTLIISIMNLRTTLFVFLCFCATTVLRAERVDMLKAGAKANGKTLNTKLINSTIDRLNRVILIWICVALLLTTIWQNLLPYRFFISHRLSDWLSD